jgi:hypothetical protein
VLTRARAVTEPTAATTAELPELETAA